MSSCIHVKRVIAKVAEATDVCNIHAIMQQGEKDTFLGQGLGLKLKRGRAPVKRKMKEIGDKEATGEWVGYRTML